MDRVRKQLGIDTIHKQGITGKNVTVCVLDSGMFMHRDLIHHVIDFLDFTADKKINNTMWDDCGHGTHVCGILAGTGAASRGKYIGVAPDAELIVGKILDRNGKGKMQDLITALEWVLNHHETYRIRIINISVGMSDAKDNLKSDGEKRRILQQYLQQLYDKNILVVTAAGNMGPKKSSLSILGENIQTICVGCHDGNMDFHGRKKCEWYSGRGPSIYSLKKPDVVAPGTEIVSCSHKNPYGYIKKSGTSMACPIVSGLAALYLEKYPDTDVDRLMNCIKSATNDLGESWSKQGYGMVDAGKLFRR